MRKTPYTKSDYISSASIKKYMYENGNSFIDKVTNEMDITGLAEDACKHFDGYENSEVPDKFFDIAFAVSEKYKTPEHRINQELAGLINSLPSDWF